MAKWLKINPTKLLEECIECFDWDETDTIFDKVREEINAGTIEMVRCWFNLGEGILEHPLYLMCDEAGKYTRPEEFNSFATLLYIGPEELQKKELERYIVGPVVLASMSNDGELLPLSSSPICDDIDAIEELYKKIKP